ncbi:hypothetical protein E4K10_22415 [Streptomyces sp. T1317-0309]|nr:hypothetical protein E4K10_22415 [Streptomyces sp. T1317-0309]
MAAILRRSSGTPQAARKDVQPCRRPETACEQRRRRPHPSASVLWDALGRPTAGRPGTSGGGGVRRAGRHTA